jgi:hypothetical protein
MEVAVMDRAPGHGLQSRSGIATSPDWALSYAQAALRNGHKSPQIEHELIAKGLSPEEAAASVDQCFEDRFAAERRTQQLMVRLRWLSRGASLLVVLMFSALGFWKEGAKGAMGMIQFFMFPLAAIWFGDVLGRFDISSFWFKYIRPTPGTFMAVTGWLVLLTYSGLLIYLRAVRP